MILRRAGYANKLRARAQANRISVAAQIVLDELSASGGIGSGVNPDVFATRLRIASAKYA